MPVIPVMPPGWPTARHKGHGKQLNVFTHATTDKHRDVNLQLWLLTQAQESYHRTAVRRAAMQPTPLGIYTV